MNNKHADYSDEDCPICREMREILPALRASAEKLKPVENQMENDYKTTNIYVVARQIAGHRQYLKSFDFLSQCEELAYQEHTSVPFLPRMFHRREQAEAQASLLINETGFFHFVVDAKETGLTDILQQQLIRSLNE